MADQIIGAQEALQLYLPHPLDSPATQTIERQWQINNLTIFDIVIVVTTIIIGGHSG